MFELLDLYAKYKRGKTEPTELCVAVESWGGTVVEHRQISRLIRSPFCGLRVFPIVYEIRANHAGRRGFWYVRTSSDGAPPDWAWLDLDGYDSLPIEHQTAMIARNAEAVSWCADWIIVGGTILFGVATCIAIALTLS